MTTLSKERKVAIYTVQRASLEEAKAKLATLREKHAETKALRELTENDSEDYRALTLEMVKIVNQATAANSEVERRERKLVTIYQQFTVQPSEITEEVVSI